MPGHHGLQPIIESSTSMRLSLHVNPWRKNPTEDSQEYPEILLQQVSTLADRTSRTAYENLSGLQATVVSGTGFTKLFETTKISFFKEIEKILNNIDD
eukprot:s1521_g3.t1